MEDRTDSIKELCEGMGWTPIHSRNPYMISFLQEETKRRLNVYYTTMTITIEDMSHNQRHHHHVTIEMLEKLLTT